MYEKILIPLDGSKVGEAAIPVIEELVNKLKPELKVEVTLIGVVTTTTYWVVAGEASVAVLYTEKELEVIKRDVSEYLEKAGEGLRSKSAIVKTMVKVGNAAEEIDKAAQQINADLIAMSTHGRSGVERVLLGSVAERVLREAPVPVLLRRAVGPGTARTGDKVQAAQVPIRPQQAAPSVQAIRHILCPVDFSRTSDAALEQAGMLAQRFGADLTVLHVVYDPLDATCLHVPHPPQEQLREEMIREAERELQARLRRRLRDLPRAKTAVVVGPPFREIVRYAQERQVDLIVMGTQGLSGLGHLIIGSTAERVVRTAPCPVLSIRAAT